MKKWKIIAALFAPVYAILIVAGVTRWETHTPIAEVAGKTVTQEKSSPNETEFTGPVLPTDPRGPETVATVPASTPTSTQTLPPPLKAPAKVTAAAKPAPTPPAPKTITTSNTAVTPAPAVGCSGSFSTQFLCLLNQYRASKGLGKLSWSSGLTGVALAHSQWMSSTGTFSHVGINGSHFYDRCAGAGVVCHAENLAEGAKSAQNLLDMWIASPAHNANLLGPYTTAGLGASGAYITLLFN